MIIWVIAGLLGLATGLRIGWALVNKQSLVSTAMILALGSLGLVAALNCRASASAEALTRGSGFRVSGASRRCPSKVRRTR